MSYLFIWVLDNQNLYEILKETIYLIKKFKNIVPSVKMV